MIGLQNLALLSILMLFGLDAGAVERPLLHRVLVFDSENTWEGVETHLEPTADGRYRTAKQQPILTGGTCQDLLSRFQSRPLRVMEENNYISAPLKKLLMNFKGQNLKARQVMLLIQESELSEVEARELIPDPKELEERTTFSPNGQRKRHVLRGAMWAVRGFEVAPNEKQLRFNNLKLPWENSKLAQGLDRTFDREKVPFIYEIGRTLSEDKPLSGNFKLLASIMTNVIANETDALGLNPRQVLITAHALDGPQGRLFSLLFPYRVLDRTAQAKIEADVQSAMVDYLQAPLPTAEEWTNLRDLVTYASLEKFIEKFPAAKISEIGVKTQAASKGLIEAQRGGYFWRDFKSLFRRDYTFSNPHLGTSTRPLIVARFGDGMFIQDLMALLKSYGMPELNLADTSTAEPIQKMLDLWSNVDVNYAPDVFLETWEGRDIILHPGTDMKVPGVSPRPISYFVTNLDRAMVRKHPRIYLASVILSLRDSVDFEITQLSPSRFLNLRDKVNEDRAMMRLPLVSTVDGDVFFETYGLGFGDTDPLIIEELALLGGVRFKGVIMRVSGNAAESGPRDLQHIDFRVAPSVGDLFEFKTAQLKKLAADYPYLRNNARANLATAHWKHRLKMMFAPTF